MTGPVLLEKGLVVHVGEASFALPLLDILEINPTGPVSPVPYTPRHVRGVVNLRGRILPVVDLGHLLGFSITGESEESCLVVVRTAKGPVGLWVEKVSDVGKWRSDTVEPLSQLIPGAERSWFLGQTRLKESEPLVVIINVSRLLEEALNASDTTSETTNSSGQDKGETHVEPN